MIKVEFTLLLSIKGGTHYVAQTTGAHHQRKYHNLIQIYTGRGTLRPPAQGRWWIMSSYVIIRVHQCLATLGGGVHNNRIHTSIGDRCMQWRINQEIYTDTHTHTEGAARYTMYLHWNHLLPNYPSKYKAGEFLIRIKLLITPGTE